MSNPFSEWITKHGLTQHAVAVAFGVGDSAIAKICKDGHWPTRAVAERIYLFTGGAVTPNDMLNIPLGVRAKTSDVHQLALTAIAEARRKRQEAKTNGKAKAKPRTAPRRDERFERRSQG